MTEFDKIYLVWRKGTGDSRTAVGEIVKTPDGSHVFTYNEKARELQSQKEFTPYTEFQDLNREYNGNVIEIFGQRLMKNDRPDIKSLYKFWEVDTHQANDKFYLLGKTQGLVPTDNFEFLADYKYSKGLSFLTEIAGLSVLKLPNGTLKNGDILTYVLEHKNNKDHFAVKLFKDGFHVGYIKKYHNKVFHDALPEVLNVQVKAIDQNGVLKRVFIKVYS